MEIKFSMFLNFFDVISIFFRCFFSMFSLSMFCLFRVFAFLCFVVLCFVIDPFGVYWMTCNFTSFSTVFQSYQDDGRLITKGCEQQNAI